MISFVRKVIKILRALEKWNTIDDVIQVTGLSYQSINLHIKELNKLDLIESRKKPNCLSWRRILIEYRAKGITFTKKDKHYYDTRIDEHG